MPAERLKKAFNGPPLRTPSHSSTFWCSQTTRLATFFHAGQTAPSRTNQISTDRREKEGGKEKEKVKK
jgi:hypothetical protein